MKQEKMSFEGEIEIGSVRVSPLLIATQITMICGPLWCCSTTLLMPVGIADLHAYIDAVTLSNLSAHAHRPDKEEQAPTE